MNNKIALTLEYAIDRKLTVYGIVRYFEPDATDEECDFILWEKTCFPFDTGSMIKQLNALYIK